MTRARKVSVPAIQPHLLIQNQVGNQARACQCNYAPMLEYTSHGSGGTYGHIDKLPRICPATEYGRNREGERRMKRYNGIVLLEVGGLSGMSEAELVKNTAALLP